MQAGVPPVTRGTTGEMANRQTNDFGATTPDAVADVLGAFAT